MREGVCARERMHVLMFIEVCQIYVKVFILQP